MTGGLILDFHRTLVVAGSVTCWLDGAIAAAGVDAGIAGEVLPVLQTVWARAGRRHPGSTWDLDGAAHRAVFMEVLVEESPCPRVLAAGLYDSMPRQWVAVPGAVDLVHRARVAGLRVGLLSNTGLDVRPCLEDLGLLEGLDDVVLSFEVGLVKPDPRIFELAARRLGVEPGRCLMVGDSPAHDGGAVVVGMPPLLVPVVDGVPRLAPVTAALGGWVEDAAS